MLMDIQFVIISHVYENLILQNSTCLKKYDRQYNITI